MSFELAFLESALAEWHGLDGSLKAQFKKKLAERLLDPRVPSAKLHGHPNVYFFPIDLEVEKRKEVLTGALAHCDISIDPYLISTVAEEWKPENPTPDNRFHDIYREKDWGKLEFLLGPKVAAVEYLRNKSAQIKPFLSELGYGDLWP